MKIQVHGGNKDRNIEEIVFVTFDIFLNQGKKERKTHGY